MLIAGIDPGKTGCLAVIEASGRCAGLFDTSVIEVRSARRTSKGTRSEYDAASMAGVLRWVRNLRGPEHVLVAIEQVGAMPGEGAVGAFKFGTGFGIWIGVAAALGLRIERVTPQRWRKAMLAGLPAGKGASLLRARELFPDQHERLARSRKDAGPADALLIAEFARRHLVGDHGRTDP